jgi:hypothetical protein
MTEKTRDRQYDVHTQYGLENAVEDDRPDLDRDTMGEGPAEAVRILTELTCDFDRFDSIIHDQRNMLECRAGQSKGEYDIDREALLFRLEAAEMATRTQKALDQLRRLAEPVNPRPHRDRAPGAGQGTATS